MNLRIARKIARRRKHYYIKGYYDSRRGLWMRAMRRIGCWEGTKPTSWGLIFMHARLPRP